MRFDKCSFTYSLKSLNKFILFPEDNFHRFVPEPPNDFASFVFNSSCTYMYVVITHFISYFKFLINNDLK